MREELARVAFDAPMTSAAEPTLAAGSRLAHYEIREVLGSGAMGTVYRSHDTALDRDVAVKVLRARLAQDPAVVERFVREARAAARVNHPNLTHVYFVGSEMGCQFFAMEFVPGATFEQEIAANGPMPLDRFVDVIVQSARGLSAAHGAGVIHRDVKPSNLMLLPGGTVKVTDFGLAKSLGSDVNASGDGSLLGTPTYMSPEQCRSRGVDARSDVYALGLTAWFLLAGRPPYASESLGQMLQDQMNTPLPSIRDVRPELPAALDRALARMCEKDPAKRPGSMDEVADLFESLRPRPLDPATFAARASAFAVDCTLLAFVSGLVAMMMQAAETLAGFDFVPADTWNVLTAAAVFVMAFGSEAFLGTSIGKWMFSLEVVRADGASPSRPALLARFLLRFPFAVGLIVLVFADHSRVRIVIAAVQLLVVVVGAALFFARRGRTLSDGLTKTRIVYRTSHVPSRARADG